MDMCLPILNYNIANKDKSYIQYKVRMLDVLVRKKLHLRMLPIDFEILFATCATCDFHVKYSQL